MYSAKQYKYGKIFRDMGWPHFEQSVPWDSLEQYAKDNWAKMFANEDGKERPDVMKKVLEMARKEEDYANYSFVSTEEDVDYVRIINEAPEGTPFILVETRTRTNQAKEWHLFIHNDVLQNPLAQGVYVGDELTHPLIKTLGPEWGYEDCVSGHLENYRCISGDGATPGYVKQQVVSVKRLLNVKNTKTFVSFL